MIEEKKKNIIIILLSIITISLLILVIILLTKTKEIKENNIINNNITENSTNETTNTITSKLITLNCENSNETFNNITISIKQKNDNGMCVLESMLINNQEIKNNLSTYVDSYEFFNDHIIINNADTSNRQLTLYNTTNKTHKSYASYNLEGYKVKSYYTQNNKIIIKGIECGAQCGNPDTEYKNATFEIEYTNNTFTEPKLIKKTN